MTQVRESYIPAPMAVNEASTVQSGAGLLGGFLCVTTGTITVYDAVSATGTPIVATMVCTAGVFHSMPFGFAIGCHVVLAGGASGTVAHGG